MVKLKKSNTIAFFVFLMVLFSLFVNYLIFKMEVDYFKKQYNKDLKIIKNLNENCFFVDKAYIIPRKNNFELLVFLPYKTIPKDYLKNIIFLNNEIYYLKKVSEVYLEKKKVNKLMFIKNSNICVK